MENTTTINGREYKVSAIETPALTSANATANGWDGKMYMLTGKRGATLAAYRSAKTGEYVIACSLRF